MTIHSRFADWYREVSIEISNDVVDLRWKGVQSILEALSTDLIMDIPRLYYDLSVQHRESADIFFQCFSKHDSSFSRSRNEYEWRVLAGITIGVAVDSENEDQKRDLLASVVQCLDIRPTEEPLPCADVPGLAKEYLERRSRSLRKRPTTRDVPVPQVQISGEVDKLKNLSADQIGQAGPVLAGLVTKLNERYKRFGKETVNWLKDYRQWAEAQDEELNIVWWMVGGLSTFDNRPLTECIEEEVCLRVGVELAELTNFSAGPMGVRAYVTRVMNQSHTGVSGEQRELQTVVEKVPKEWKEQLLNRRRMRGQKEIIVSVRDITPITYALFASVESPETWAATWAEIVGLDPRMSLNLVELSNQIYIEILFLKQILKEG